MRFPVIPGLKMTRRHYFQIFLLTGILLRVLFLADRPLHKDESVFAMFGFDWFVSPSDKFYHYDPRFHGPVLYEGLLASFSLFGVGIKQARLVPALAGCLLMAVPLLFQRWWGTTASLIGVGLLALSPQLSYFSRFVHADGISLLLCSVALYAFLRYREAQGEKWVALCAAAAGAGFATKGTAFLQVFVFFSFVLFWTLFRWWAARGTSAAPRRFFLPRPRDVGVFMAVFIAVYAFLQTAFFSHLPAFAAGLYGEVFGYWWGQHDVERMYAPMTYHLRSLALHELPILAALTLGWLYVFGKERMGRIAALVVLLSALLLLPRHEPFSARSAWTILLKARTPSDLFPFVLAFSLGAVGTFLAARRGNWVLGLTCYWAYGSIAMFSFIGEKVPWLTSHVVVPCALFAAYVIATIVKREAAGEGVPRPAWVRPALSVVLVGMAVYQARLAYVVNFVTAGEPTDVLSQYHTHRDVPEVVQWLKRYGTEKGIPPQRLRVATLGKIPAWSFLFYFAVNRIQNVAFETRELNGKEAFVILDAEHQRMLGDRLKKSGYKMSELIIAGSWAPERFNLGWKDWLEYAISRRNDGSFQGEPFFVHYRP